MKKRSAIMDIGYNAIRAVVYENDTLGSPEIFNSKFKNDILSLLTSESIDIKHQVYLSIEYLLHVFEKLNVGNIHCVATAVLRNHPRADDFIKYIKSKYDFDIKVISGEEEATLTARGLISGITNGNGVIADLGGGSLELIEINNDQIETLKSFDLGTKVMDLQNISDELQIIEILEKHYENNGCENLYLIGGALRFIGREYVKSTEYPLKNLHNLEIPTKVFSSYLKKLNISNDDIKYKTTRKQITNNAIFIAKALIKIFEPENIVISTYGLKEGVRISNIPKSETNKDIILEKAKLLCNFDEASVDWEDYFMIVNPLLPDNFDYSYIIKLSIILSSLKYKFDRALQHSAMTSIILSSEIPFTHKTRVLIAMILAYSQNYKAEAGLMKLSKILLSKQEHKNCQIIGSFLYIAELVDGHIFSKPSFTIKITDNYLEIDSNKILPRLIFDKICTSLKSIAFARKNNTE